MMWMISAVVFNGVGDQLQENAVGEAKRLPAALTGFDAVALREGVGAAKDVLSNREANAMLS